MLVSAGVIVVEVVRWEGVKESHWHLLINSMWYVRWGGKIQVWHESTRKAEFLFIEIVKLKAKKCEGDIMTCSGHFNFGTPI